jgi:hypothetical protein
MPHRAHPNENQMRKRRGISFFEGCWFPRGNNNQIRVIWEKPLAAPAEGKPKFPDLISFVRLLNAFISA